MSKARSWLQRGYTVPMPDEKIYLIEMTRDLARFRDYLLGYAKTSNKQADTKTIDAKTADADLHRSEAGDALGVAIAHLNLILNPSTKAAPKH